MSKSRPKIDKSQMNIFDLIRDVQQRNDHSKQQNEAGKYDIDHVLRGMLSEALKQTSKSRWSVAAEMSEFIGAEITKTQLDSWTAESKEFHRFPFAYAPAFCASTGDSSIVHLIAQTLKGFYIDGEDAIRLELGKIEEQKAQLTKRERAIKEFLKGVEK